MSEALRRHHSGQLLLCTLVTLRLKGTKEQTLLMLCDESRGKVALRKQLAFLQQPGWEINRSMQTLAST